MKVLQVLVFNRFVHRLYCLSENHMKKYKSKCQKNDRYLKNGVLDTNRPRRKYLLHEYKYISTHNWSPQILFTNILTLPHSTILIPWAMPLKTTKFTKLLTALKSITINLKRIKAKIDYFLSPEFVTYCYAGDLERIKFKMLQKGILPIQKFDIDIKPACIWVHPPFWLASQIAFLIFREYI